VIQLMLNFTNDVAEAEAIARPDNDDDNFTEDLRRRNGHPIFVEDAFFCYNAALHQTQMEGTDDVRK
jgi:hypothetical protein